MKKLYLIVGITFALTQVSAQALVDNFGNLKTFDAIAREPWNIQSSSNPSIDNTDQSYHVGNVGIGDFSAIITTQKLDVAGNVRIRALVDGADQSLFPRNLIAQANGTLGYEDINIPLFQKASGAITIIKKNTVILLIDSAEQTNIEFPTTPANGAYDGRIIQILNRQPAPARVITNIKFNDLVSPISQELRINYIPAQTQMTFSYSVSPPTQSEWNRIF